MFLTPAGRLAFRLLRGALLVFITILLVRAFDARRMPDLCVWHTADLTEEFRHGDETKGFTLADYLDLENRLFSELEAKVYRQVQPQEMLRFSRYLPGGPNDPKQFPRNWNRTFELIPTQPKGGALLLHGLTDSPYSLRRIGEILHREGYYVLGLRLPGHGTIPGALTRATSRDWMAAARVGGRSVRDKIGTGQPFLVVGYSNGGALAVKYALEALEDPALPPPDRLILLSPALGITRYAALSRWAAVFAVVPFFEKSRWNSVSPEYDPFKYNSFPLHAADQTYRLARSVKSDLARLAAQPTLERMPPVLTFQSLIDSTVHASAVVDVLYHRLGSETSELVLFDINRYAPLKYFVAADPAAVWNQFETGGPVPYRTTLLTNADETSSQLAEVTRLASATTMTSTPLELTWPRNIFSLSHVALPFAPDDPIYGAEPGNRQYGLSLGRVELRGEKSLLRVSADDYMRLRFNPFFSYVERRVRETVQAHGR